ncbi:MAG: hypothetical protein DHS20C14_03960 [Phycisphaeraceae bacterium]|nr:MAG: hypothetical protein DHS20C14_03960 [Phycisphaeraceae bacterium]
MPCARTTTIAALLLAAPALADTTMTAPNIYEVDEGVAFTMSNSGASDFLFTWTDGSGTFTDIADPTLILSAGQTYTFARTTSSHPFGITDGTLGVTGTDGSYARTSTEITDIDAAMLQPAEDFIADPAPTADVITWALVAGDAGDYFYTCRVQFHADMTGRIEVVAAGCNAADCDANGVLNVDDVDCFVTAFLGGDLGLADCDGSGVLNVDDIDCFVADFLAGCP